MMSQLSWWRGVAQENGQAMLSSVGGRLGEGAEKKEAKKEIRPRGSWLGMIRLGRAFVDNCERQGVSGVSTGGQLIHSSMSSLKSPRTPSNMICATSCCATDLLYLMKLFLNSALARSCLDDVGGARGLKNEPRACSRTGISVGKFQSWITTLLVLMSVKKSTRPHCFAEKNDGPISSNLGLAS